MADTDLASPLTLGLTYDLPIEQYHADATSVSKSGLDHLARSPAHFFGLHRDPARPVPEQTPSQLAGNLAHCSILEPEQFALRYVTLPPDAPRRPSPAQWAAKNPSDASREAMAWWSQWNERTKGATDVTAEQYATAMRQRESVHALQDVWGGMSARQILERCRCEVSGCWVDPATGVRCRCRPDAVFQVSDRQVVLLDVKTFGDARTWEFSRQVARMRYHVQDAFYSDGYAQAAGVEVLAFIFLVVEDAFPFAAAAYRLDEDSRFEGIDEVRRLLALYAECERTSTWPGLAQSTQTIALPPWAMTAHEVEIAYA